MATPDAPLARARTQSLVDMSPSTVTRLMVRFTQSASMACHASPEMSASQQMKESMVAMFGEIMPAPLHMPSSRTSPPFSSKDAAASLCTVSVVMIALAVSLGVPVASDSASAGMAASHLAMSNCAPMTPVDAGSSSSAGTPSALAARFRVSRQLARPWSPVQALAWPELTRNPDIFRPSASISLHCSTGAAWNLLVVNTPAATPGASLTMAPRSSLSFFLNAAMAAANRNPLGISITVLR